MEIEPIIKPLFDYGVIGVLVVLILTGFLIPKPFYERESTRADTATAAAEKNAEALKVVLESDKAVIESNRRAEEAAKRVEEEIKGLRADMRAKTNA